MGFQFIHFETYARSPAKYKRPSKYAKPSSPVGGVDGAAGRSASQILDEMERKEDACPHIEHPMPPTILFGSREDVEKDMAEYADQARDALGHKLRKDSAVLLAGVFSAPDDMSDADWEKEKKLAILFLKEIHGDRLKMIAEHHDENFRHCHFYAVPGPGQSIDDLHIGRSAARNAKAEGKTAKECGLAYKEAMRAYQDAFHEVVGKEVGLTRLGPSRRRLTRAEWQKEQQQAKTLARAPEIEAKEARLLVLEKDITKREETLDRRVDAIDNWVNSRGDELNIDQDKLDAEQKRLNEEKEKLQKHAAQLHEISKQPQMQLAVKHQEAINTIEDQKGQLAEKDKELSFKDRTIASLTKALDAAQTQVKELSAKLSKYIGLSR